MLVAYFPIHQKRFRVHFQMLTKIFKKVLIFHFLCVRISPRPDAKMHRSFGGIAQLVEQMTFNHWVQSSNLCASTKNNWLFLQPFLFIFVKYTFIFYKICPIFVTFYLCNVWFSAFFEFF